MVKIFDDGLKDDYARQNAPDGTVIEPLVMDRMQEFFKTTSLEKFRDELLKFCETQHVDIGRLKNDKEWAQFIDYYCRVIEDCPLLCRDASTMYAKAVIVRRMDIAHLSAFDPNRDYLCAITWFWVDANGEVTQNIITIPTQAAAV